jgi:hypothetical protein
MADLVLTIGYDIAEHDPAGRNRGTETDIVHVDSEPAEVYQAYNPDLELVCDLSTALATLTERMDETGMQFDDTWYGDLRDHIHDDVAADPAADDPFTVQTVLPVLRDVMDDADVLLSDVGSHKMHIAQNFPTYEPNTCIISNGLASMGISVPGGIAADLATDGAVVAATGDGGFLMNAAEIETATRIGCGYTILLFVDDDYGLISPRNRTPTAASPSAPDSRTPTSRRSPRASVSRAIAQATGPTSRRPYRRRYTRTNCRSSKSHWGNHLPSRVEASRMVDLRVRVDSHELTASWTDENPTTRRAIEEALPLEGLATRWGDELYFQTDVDVPPEDAQTTVPVGAIAYWPAGNAICVLWGETPASHGEEPRAASPVTVIALLEDVAPLAAIEGGATLRIEQP